MNKILLSISIVIVLIATLFTIYKLPLNKQVASKNNNFTTANWKKYTDPQNIYTFKYPAQYEVSNGNQPNNETIIVTSKAAPDQPKYIVISIVCPRGEGIYRTQFPDLDSMSNNEGGAHALYRKSFEQNNFLALQYIWSASNGLTTDVMRKSDPYVCEINGPFFQFDEGMNYALKIKSLDFYNQFLSTFTFNR